MGRLRGREVTILLGLVGLLLAAGPATAQTEGSAEARVEPEVAAPGQAIDLILTVQGPPLVEASVQEEVTCTLTSPDGTERAVCQRQGSMVQARLIGETTREHLFPYQAPADLGVYEVDFQVTSTVTLPPQTYTASATFTVVSPGDPALGPGSGSGSGAGGTNASGPGDGGPGDGTDDVPGDDTDDDTDDEQIPLNEFGPLSGNEDEARLFVSTTLGLAVVGAALVAQRWPMGGT